MKKTSPDRSKETPRKRKQKRRGKIISLPEDRTSLIPNGKNGSKPRCPKCKGFLVIHYTDLSPLLEIRCINCGWQPQLRPRIVGVNKEIQSIRNLTAKMFSQPSVRLSVLSENRWMEQ